MPTSHNSRRTAPRPNTHRPNTHRPNTHRPNTHRPRNCHRNRGPTSPPAPGPSRRKPMAFGHQWNSRIRLCNRLQNRNRRSWAIRFCNRGRLNRRRRQRANSQPILRGLSWTSHLSWMLLRTQNRVMTEPLASTVRFERRNIGVRSSVGLRDNEGGNESCQRHIPLVLCGNENRSRKADSRKHIEEKTR